MSDTLIYIIIGAFIVYGIYYLVMNGNEGRKRKAMIINPNDLTVS